MRRLEKAVKINCKSKSLQTKQICKQQNNNHHHLKNKMKLKAREKVRRKVGENVLKNMYNKPENNTQK